MGAIFHFKEYNEYISDLQEGKRDRAEGFAAFRERLENEYVQKYGA